MLPFHTPTVVKVLRIVGLSLFPLLCLQQMRNRSHPYLGGTAKFGRDWDRFSEMEDVTIPYSNCSQSIKDSWFVSFPTLVPTTNAKSLTPLYRGTAKFGQDTNRSSRDRKCYHSVFRTPTVLKVLKIVGLSFSPLLFLQQTICSS